MQESYLQAAIGFDFAEYAKYRKYSIQTDALWLSRFILFMKKGLWMFFSGKKINFDFEVDRTALVYEQSCGAWLNGEYYIITGASKETESILRKVKVIHYVSVKKAL